MPLLINAISKLSVNCSTILHPDKDVIYKNLILSKTIMHKTVSVTVKPSLSKRSHSPNVKFADMTTEQKRKYLLSKYVRQYT